MLPVLQDYLAICSRFPAKAPLDKSRRKQRHAQLMGWLEREYALMPDWQTIQDFIRMHPTLSFEKPFYQKVVMPCVEQELAEDHLEALKFLFAQTIQDDHIGTDRDLIFLFEQATNWRYDPLQLADRVLADDAHNQAVLIYKYQTLLRQIANSIHEVPWGVLNGMNGAEVSALPRMHEMLESFVQTAAALGYDERSWADYCHTLYTAWGDYLEQSAHKQSFEDYLDEQGINYE